MAKSLRERRAGQVLLAVGLIAVVAWGVIALVTRPEGPDDDPCGFITDDVVARSIGASSWDDAAEGEDAAGTYCTYFASGSPLLTTRAKRLNDPGGSWSLGGEGVDVCGATVRSDGPMVEISGRRWSVRLERPGPGSKVPEEVVTTVAQAIGTGATDPPSPVNFIDFNRRGC